MPLPRRSADPLAAPQPPPLARWLVSRAAPADDRADVLHDLAEGFAERAATSGAAAARSWYWRQTLRSAPPLVRRRLTRRATEGRAPLLADLRTDLRYAARRAGRTPVVSLAVVLAMTLGIGATTAIVSVMESVLILVAMFPVVPMNGDTALPEPTAPGIMW